MTINEEASQAKVSESDNGKIDPRASSTTGDASYISIAEIFDFVKRNGGKFESGSKNPVYFNPKPVNPAFLNEDGTPKVFYHGTNKEWTTYDLSKNVNQMWGEGIYLTPDPERARLYGDHVMAFYVKADADNRIATKNGIQRDYTVMKKTVMCLYICPIR